MDQWSEALESALQSGDAAWMKAALGRVPPEVVHRVVPQIAMIGNSLAHAGQPADALVHFEQLAALVPEEVRWHVRCSQLQLEVGQPEAAADSAMRAVAKAPNDAATHRVAAAAFQATGDLRAARDAWQRVVEFDRDHPDAAERLREIDKQIREQEILERITQPEERPTVTPVSSLPEVAFDPAWLLDPAITADSSSLMVDGLREHLRRYSSLHAPKNALRRLEQPAWSAAWDRVLENVAGHSVVFWGSELGVLADRALQRGAARVTVIETSPHARRIAAGVIQKNQLLRWHRDHGAALADTTEEARRESFESHSATVPVLAPDSQELQGLHADVFVFAELDHSILGSGLLHALDRFRQAGGTVARVAPAAARLFAVPIQWEYPSADFDLAPVDALRWSFAPEALEHCEGYVTLSEPAELGRFEFGTSEWPRVWQHQVSVTRPGRVDAIVFWAEWELDDGVRLSAAPGADSGVAPGVQFADPVNVEAGSGIALTITASATRLALSLVPAPERLRKARLPSWYVPMLLDGARNEAYRAALARLSAQAPLERVLDIGAGCGLLSMMAAQAGARHVYGCEVSPAVVQIGHEVVACNGFADRITLIGKDCRQLSVPTDLPERADLAVFEMFDCSFLGEGVLHFLAYAREHLLKPDARYLPISAVLRAQLIEHRIDSILDVDVTLLNPYRYTSGFVNVDAARLAYRPLTAPFDLFRFDLRTAGPAPAQLEVETRALDAGIAGAVLFWFDLQLDEDTWISNAPDAGLPMHWKQAMQFLPEIRVEPDMPLALLALHDGASIAFKWQDGAVPQGAVVPLPRFDPRVLNEAAELDQRTEQLLQHLMQDPQGVGYASVVGVASRFAVDPASHDVDARIAHRFASSFFQN